MQHLALQVVGGDDVIVHDPERADADGCEVEQGRRSESARADRQHPRVAQPTLAHFADLGNRDGARIPGALGIRQFGHGFNQGIDHDCSFD